MAQEQVGKPLSSWEKGVLDIHHINTGRGTTAYCIFPDGTTFLIDAGELSPLDARTFTKRNASIKPDSTKKPFEWIVQYIHKVAPSTNKEIDYALVTHFHDDHFGAWYPDAPLSLSGNFRLTGITGVGEKIKIKTLIDRGAPDYNYPYDMKVASHLYGGGEIQFDSTMHNYFKFMQEKRKQGMQVVPFRAGSVTQVRMKRKREDFPAFYVRNIKANQFIWSGKDSSVAQHFPTIDSVDKNTWPDENSLSLALTIHYGDFLYHTGGDIAGNVFTGGNPLRDVETPVARVVGEVDVAIMNHHGNRDAVNEYTIKTLRPSVWIGQTWSADHPGHEVLLRLTNPHIRKDIPDLFATNMLEANRLVMGPVVDKAYKSYEGHIVVRVMPGGSSYYVIILDDTIVAMPVKAVFGPYFSKKQKSK